MQTRLPSIFWYITTWKAALGVWFGPSCMLDKSFAALPPSILTGGAWWLAEHPVDSGGLNGRPEKQDMYYSWWILLALSILRCILWINGDKLATSILKCQDKTDGGIEDWPDDVANVFHTFFGIAELSLLGHLHKGNNSGYQQIDPTYASSNGCSDKAWVAGTNADTRKGWTPGRTPPMEQKYLQRPKLMTHNNNYRIRLHTLYCNRIAIQKCVWCQDL